MSLKSFLSAALVFTFLPISISAVASDKNIAPARLLAKYDANGDRLISLSEVEEKRKQIFSAMDYDRDGDVTFAEYERLDNTKRATLLKARFNKLDLNQDGQLSDAEYASYLGSFDRLDQNSDGQLSHSEIQKTSAIAPAKVKREADHCVLWFCVRKEAF